MKDLRHSRDNVRVPNLTTAIDGHFTSGVENGTRPRMTALFGSNHFRRPSQMRDRWYVPGLILCLVIASLSIFLSLRMRGGMTSASGEYVRWKILLGDLVFLPVLMIVL